MPPCTSAAEMGKQVIAYDGTKPILALMSGSGVVGMYILCGLQTRLQDLTLLSVKGLFILHQEPVHKTSRNIYP